jgi:hypothetical protein
MEKNTNSPFLVDIIDTTGEPNVLAEVNWGKLSENKESINHPAHYGGADNPYEAIKIIDAYNWGHEFSLGNAIKYILRAGKKEKDPVKDLEKALWYINHAIENLRK